MGIGIGIFIVTILILSFIQSGNYSSGQYENDRKRNENLDIISSYARKSSRNIEELLKHQLEKDKKDKQLEFKKTLRKYEEM